MVFKTLKYPKLTIFRLASNGLEILLIDIIEGIIFWKKNTTIDMQDMILTRIVVVCDL